MLSLSRASEALAGAAAFSLLAGVAFEAVFAHPQPVLPPRAASAPADATVVAVESELALHLVGGAPGEAHLVAAELVAAARRASFDPWFVLAVVEVESAYRVEACSPTGALGLMQLLPSTFRTVSSHYRVTDPVENVRAGIAYLAQLYASGFRRPESALRAYNGGPAAAGSYARAVRSGADESGFSTEMLEYPGRVLVKYRRLLRAAGRDYRHPEKAWRSPA